ncbi:hypothetical protein NPIL_75331 [Nephila pilipes]|uniref:Uncharacterized protein n=1 Tax=Nephila pilipes TaxID=299642 RepID=A0A8X6QP26_NEPPI|nr:hypothetical protein NPIL_75331 [Nephila pilipes]
MSTGIERVRLLILRQEMVPDSKLYCGILMYDCSESDVQYKHDSLSDSDVHLGSVVSGNTTILVTTFDAVVVPNVHSQTEQQTYNELELEAKFFPLQGTTSLNTPKRADREATIPVVRTFFVWKMCQALDLPATFEPLKTGANFSQKQLKTNKRIPIVHSIAVFKMCKVLELNATLAPQ